MNKKIILLTTILCSVPVHTVWAGSFEESNTDFPSDLPDLTSTNKSEIVEVLKQYIVAGEKLVSKFKGLLTNYQSVAKEVVGMKTGCYTDDFLSGDIKGGIWAKAHESSICNPKNEKKHNDRLRSLAIRLDAGEEELKTIKRKLKQASREIGNISQQEKAMKLLDDVESNVNEVDNIRMELEDIEK